MHSLYFWKLWPARYQAVWYSLSALFILGIIAVAVFYVQGMDTIASWQKFQEQKVIDTIAHAFKIGPFQLSIPSESFVIMEWFSGSEIHHNFISTYIFLLVFAVAVSVLISVISTLDNFWYFAGMSLFIVFIIALRFDVLMLFGISSQAVAIGVMLLYILPSFYFRFVRPAADILVRIITFASLTAILSIVIAIFSKVDYPGLHMLITGYTPALILTVLFIIMVAHEVLVAFVYITNQGNSGNNVKHFALISFLYLAYVTISCLHEIGVVNWNIIYINPLLLLLVSAILGVWGFRLRENLYENFFTYDPIGGIFYIALACICAATIAQFTGNHNDATMRVIRQSIFFTHTGFGIIFLLYFFSNFLAMLAANLQVYRILYKPNRMPYFTFRFAGIIASLAFLFYSNWHDFVGHGMGGFYNYAGDLHMLQNSERSARSFYELSKTRSFQSNRANYELGVIKTSSLAFEAAAHNYEMANAKNPNEYSLVNEADLNFWDSDYFTAIKDFKSAMKRMPSSAVISNNLGYAYAKIHSLDSASLHLSNARKNDVTKSSAEANFIALAATELIPISTDSVVAYFNSSSPAVHANAYGLATLFGQRLKINADPLSDAPLDLYSATLLNNYINYNIQSLDSVFIGKALKIASDTLNISYREQLKTTIAIAYYQQGNVRKAFEILGELTYLTQNLQGKYNYIIGLMAMEQRAPKIAVGYFTNADVSDYKHAKFYKAIALTEAGQAMEAELAWDSLLIKDNEAVKVLARQLINILQVPYTRAATLPDAEKYQFCRYRLGLRDTTFLNSLLPTFSNTNYQAQVLLDFSKKFHSADMMKPAVKFLTRVNGLKLTDENLYNEFRLFELELLAAQGDVRGLATRMPDVANRIEKLHKLYYDALVANANGDKKTAERNFDILGKFNPFFEDGTIAAADFYRKQNNLKQSYDILVNGIYTNSTSLKLLKAYAAEAARQGFDEYALSAGERIKEMEAALH
jgi:hypothetical protein